MFVIGKGVKGGFYGQHPSLTDLDDGNMKMTTDFRRVYATMITEWLGCDDTAGRPEGPLPTRSACSCELRTGARNPSEATKPLAASSPTRPTL